MFWLQVPDTGIGQTTLRCRNTTLISTGSRGLCLELRIELTDCSWRTNFKYGYAFYLPHIYAGVYHTPMGLFSNLDCLTIQRVPIPNGASSESSRRGASNADILAPTLSQLWRYRPLKIDQGGCDIHRRRTYGYIRIVFRSQSVHEAPRCIFSSR